MWMWISIAVVAVVAFAGWTLYRRRAGARFDALVDKRRSTSLLVSSGEFVDGNRHLKVALALTESELFYENDDMQAALDLQWIREVVYDTQLATGQEVAGGSTVLRLRCFSQVFEFVLPAERVAQWQAALPPHARDASPARAERAIRIASAT